MTKLDDLQTPNFPNWCPGCGNFNIWAAFKNAAVHEGWDNSNSVAVAGIGCHGHMLNFVKITSFEGLHGRAIPIATGIKMANNRLNVFVFTGDGDCFGEGGNHFVHACRRNHNLKVFIHDNSLYALTTGQTSPLSVHGFKSRSTPSGNLDEPVNPLVLAVASGATFVARAYAGDIPQLTELMIEANNHKGFAVIDILQPCVTFNKVCTHTFYQGNTYYLEKEYDPSNKQNAFERALETGPKHIPLGIFYKSKQVSYETQVPQIRYKPLIEIPVNRPAITELFKKYT